MPDLRNYALTALAALTFVLGLSTWSYRTQAKASNFALALQNNAIKAQNTAAEQLLKRRTEERDALQKKLDERAAAQEKTDEKAVARIGVDDKQQRAAPVRVRVLNCTRDAGSSGGRTPGEATAASGAGAEDAGAASGVLSKAGAGRLADALTEIETMSAAYASCRAGVIPPAVLQ
ncbi:hypothetical protein GmRootV59_13280 [Variovorax sp. V59]|uniref:hypothetical protein n=1 Tax=unclassified Variovorax TaxID=663243 RepID=UPI0034E8DCF0